MYIKLTNGVPTLYTIGQLRRDNPNTSFPKTVSNEILAMYDVYPCVVAEQPSHNEKTHRVEDGDFELQDGVWTKTWTVVEKTQEEIDAWLEAKANDIRSLRNQLLAETDYLALSDNTLTAEMAAYRQALRDITNQAGFPETVEWPIKPE
jgi:hypothetical protein